MVSFLQRWQQLRYTTLGIVDPEHTVAKSAFRTALACALCILLFQYVETPRASVLAGFAAFTFVQNDPQGLAWPRLWILTAIVIVFTALATAGMLIGPTPMFLWTLLPLSFVCAYSACLGPQYFNAGAWALLLYVFASANPVPWPEAQRIAAVLLICGAICIMVCFWVFPLNPYQRMIRSYRLIVSNCLSLIYSEQQQQAKRAQKFYRQIDHLLVLQQRNLHLYFKACGLAKAERYPLTQIAKSMYQLSLLLKSSLASRHRICQYARYPDTRLETCHAIIAALLAAVLQQVKRGSLPDFTAADSQLERLRDHLTEFRQKALREAAQGGQAVDFGKIFEFSDYFYQVLKLLEALRLASQQIAVLRKYR